MVITKKLSTEYSQKETKRKSKRITTKNQVNTEEGSKGWTEGHKSCDIKESINNMVIVSHPYQ